jgi:hypothetical protein
MEDQKIKLMIMDYSTSPGPRYSNQGDDSGEDFYHKRLNEAFNHAISSDQKLEINLDGPDGYASSFLDEAFGNLVYDFGLDTVKSNLTVLSDEEPEWVTMLNEETFLEWEERRKKQEAPKKTADHKAWYRKNGDQITSSVWIPRQ